MSKRGRIRNKVVRSTINDNDVLSIFHGILGTGDVTDLNIEIVYPKYRKIAEHCERFMVLLEAIQTSAVLKAFVDESAHLASYIKNLREQAAACFTAPDLSALHPPSQLEKEIGGKLVEYSAVTREEYDAFVAVYKSVKESNIVNTVVITCKNLIEHKTSLEDPSKLKDRFLTRTAVHPFAPLPGLPAMNFKHFYISDEISQQDKRFLLLVLSKMYKISHDVYDAATTPDVDVDEFVNMIMGSLAEVKKHLPRCDDAFNKIADSVNLLKGNFNGYYKDYIASNNPAIILENFVMDVSAASESTATLTRQFRVIINHYRKISAQHSNNPKLKNLFHHVDKNFQELANRETGEAAGEEDDDGSSCEEEKTAAPCE